MEEPGNCVKQDLLIAFIFLYDVRVIVFLCFLDKRTIDFLDIIIPSTTSSSDRVMIRSRVCPLEWVGVATCCFRLKDSSRL